MYYNIVVLSRGRSPKVRRRLHSIKNRCILFAYEHSSYCCDLSVFGGRRTVPSCASEGPGAQWAEAEDFGTQQETPRDQGYARQTLHPRHSSWRVNLPAPPLFTRCRSRDRQRFSRLLMFFVRSPKGPALKKYVMIKI